ncbi:MAG TPA: LiaF domain-containing protein [Bacteroidota bacterium]|nr:LiaF domain-containing protein [Bacteroidota bacterium]
MKKAVRHIARSVPLTGVLCLAAAVGLAGDADREIGRTTEKELHVVLSASFGKISVARGEKQKIFWARGRDGDNETAKLVTDYAVRDRVGYLDISLGSGKHDAKGKRSSFKLSEFAGGDWQLGFTDALPISFDVELGVAGGTFDMTGLMVKDFNLSCGASEVVLSFSQPNAATIDAMNIECGVSKFEGRNLGNANFKHFRFEGGVGAATLDFSGELRNEVDVDIEIGVGVCTVIIPETVGVQVFADDNLTSRISLDSRLHEEESNRYISENFKNASTRMNVRIQAGIGSVRVKLK